MIRTFLAIPIPDRCKEEVEPLRRLLSKEGRHLKLVEPRNLHVTLKFLGDVEETRIGEIASMTQAAVAGITPFTIHPRGTGIFPSPARPRVFWLGLHEPRGLLEKLHSIIDETLEAVGFQREPRGFKGHLTLARAKGRVRRETVAAFLKASFEALPFEVTGFHIFSSTLTPEGPIYKKLEHIALE